MYVEERLAQLCSYSLSAYDDCLVADLMNYRFARDPLGTHRTISTALCLHTVCRVAIARKDTGLLEWCHDAFLEFLDAAVYPDGSTFAYRDHDSLMHHLECVLFSLDICHLLRVSNPSTALGLLYHQNVRGACLVDAVLFLVPFLTGTKKNYPFRFSTHGAERQVYAGLCWTPDMNAFFFHYLQKEFPELYVLVESVSGVSIHP